MSEFTVNIVEGEEFGQDGDSCIEVYITNGTLDIKMDITEFSLYSVEDYEEFSTNGNTTLVYDDCNGYAGLRWKNSESIELMLVKYGNSLEISLPSQASVALAKALLSKRREILDHES